MQTYNKPYAIIASLCSADLYRDVKQRWQGLGLSYLLILTTIMVSTLVLVGSIVLNDYLFKRETPSAPNRLEQFALSISKQMPTLVWQQGQMELRHDYNGELTQETPDIYVTIGHKEIHLIHIDPNATKSTAESIEAMAILTRDAALIRKSAGLEERSWDSLGIEDGFTMNSDIAAMHGQAITAYIEKNRQLIIGCLAMFIWAVSMLLLFLWHTLQSLAFGVVVLMFGSYMKVPMPYQTAVRLAAVAITPAILINTAVTLSMVGKFPFIAFVMIVTCYAAFAVNSNRDNTATTEGI